MRPPPHPHWKCPPIRQTNVLIENEIEIEIGIEIGIGINSCPV